VKSAIVSSLLNEQVLFPNRGLSLHRFSSAYITLQVDCNILEGHLNVAFGDNLSCDVSQAGTAWHFHVNYGQTIQFIRLQDCCYLFDI
jgi:Lon protease-like protein